MIKSQEKAGKKFSAFFIDSFFYWNSSNGFIVF